MMYMNMYGVYDNKGDDDEHETNVLPHKVEVV